MRKSISVAFFSLVSTLMVLGIVLMGASEWVLFKNYFAKDRYETLDQVVGFTQRTAQYLVQQAELPEGDELDALSTKLEIIGESAEAYLFFTDNDGLACLQPTGGLIPLSRSLAGLRRLCRGQTDRASVPAPALGANRTAGGSV